MQIKIDTVVSEALIGRKIYLVVLQDESSKLLVSLSIANVSIIIQE